jgi:glutathione S-transferase
MLDIYGRASSSNVQKVLWLCEELNLPHRTAHDVPPGKAGTDDYKRLNPTGKIPTLVEPDGFTLWESNAILRYLAAKHAPGSTIWPADLRLRANADRWMDWQACTIAPVATTVLYQTIRAKPETKDPAALASASQASREAAGLLDAQLKGKAYVVGDDFTLADIALGQWVWRYVSLVEQRPAHPHLMAWYARLQGRAPFRKIVMTKLV